MIFGNKVNTAWMLCFFVQPMRLKVFSYKESMMVQYSIFLHGDYCHSNYGMMKKNQIMLSLFYPLENGHIY